MKAEKPDRQSPAERRSTEATLGELVTKLAPGHERLVAAMRRSLRDRLPTAHELVYGYKSWFVISFSPNEHGYDGVLAIRGDEKGISLFFNRGKDLPDPEKLLRGSAKLVRSIPVDVPSVLTRPAVAALVDEALARNPLPFPTDGTGRVLIRS